MVWVWENKHLPLIFGEMTTYLLGKWNLPHSGKNFGDSNPTHSWHSTHFYLVLTKISAPFPLQGHTISWLQYLKNLMTGYGWKVVNFKFQFNFKLFCVPTHDFPFLFISNLLNSNSNSFCLPTLDFLFFISKPIDSNSVFFFNTPYSQVFAYSKHFPPKIRFC